MFLIRRGGTNVIFFFFFLNKLTDFGLSFILKIYISGEKREEGGWGVTPHQWPVFTVFTVGRIIGGRLHVPILGPRSPPNPATPPPTWGIA